MWGLDIMGLSLNIYLPKFLDSTFDWRITQYFCMELTQIVISHGRSNHYCYFVNILVLPTMRITSGFLHPSYGKYLSNSNCDVWHDCGKPVIGKSNVPRQWYVDFCTRSINIKVYIYIYTHIYRTWQKGNNTSNSFTTGAPFTNTDELQPEHGVITPVITTANTIEWDIDSTLKSKRI